MTDGFTVPEAIGVAVAVVEATRPRRCADERVTMTLQGETMLVDVERVVLSEPRIIIVTVAVEDRS